MRWTPKLSPVEQGERIITRFLFFPRTINNQTRWLETVHILQQYHVYYDSSCWIDVDWVDG